MNRNQIIESLYNDERFNDCISKMEPESLREDLKSEVILIMLGQPEEKLISMFKKDELIFFAVKVITNMVQSKTSPFHKMFRGKSTGFFDNFYESAEEEAVKADAIWFNNRYAELNNRNGNLELKARLKKEEQEDPLYEILLKVKRIVYQDKPQYIKELEDIGVNWYSQYMLSLYMKEGTYRAMEKEIKKYNNWIDHGSCHNTVKKAIELLKQYVTPRINNTLLAGICLLCSRGDAA